MRVRYELRLVFDVDEDPGNPFPVESMAEAFRLDDDVPGVIESRVETTRTELGAVGHGS